MPSSNPNFYRRYQTPDPDWNLFQSPPAVFRGTPLWSWNNRLDKRQLLKQIADMHEMGLGGFHIHVRTGLDTPYLGDEFMDMVRACMEKAREKDMLCWLYDEDRWPSGFAGGLVTQDTRYRARHLLWTTAPSQGAGASVADPHHAMAVRSGGGTLLARYEVTLEDGCLAGYRRLAEDEEPSVAGTLWYAYLETSVESSWYNNQTYVDTLSRAAIEQFIAITHERYQQVVGEEFGGVVPAIFSDEPQFSPKYVFARPEDTNDLFLPWTDDLPDTFRAAYGEDILDHLPEIFWELPDGRASVPRYRYHDHVAERFAEAFADTLGAWCEANGLALTGHMLYEESLTHQTSALGEAMRSYRSFQLPGIDILCDNHEYSTAKQAQSASRQFGRGGVMSELYGVTNWDFPFLGHKAQGDWQAALGVTVRVPHLTWVSMAGEAKRDYPASIGYQSPWYREYRLIEDHFGRVNSILTRGTAGVRVAVIHPIESLWLCYGPRQQTELEREERETAFSNVIEWLLFGLVDFDFVAESLLPAQTPAQAGTQFHVGQMAYDVVVAPGLRTIRATTLDRLEAFTDAGGAVIFAGEVPLLVDAAPSDRPARLAARSHRVELRRTRLLNALEPYRDLDVRLPSGAPADALLHQLRNDGDRRFLFLVNTDRQHPRSDVTIGLRGEWALTLLDTLTGERTPLAARYADGRTERAWTFPAHGHALLMLEPGRREDGDGYRETRWDVVAHLADPVPVTLSEPNVLLLDRAEYRIDDGPWLAEEETLRIENIARARFGLPENNGSIAQPWVDARPVTVAGCVEMRFAVHSDVHVAAPLLALEEPSSAEVFWDGASVATTAAGVTGWWVDEAIQTVPLPPISAGTHTLLVRLPFTRKTPMEWMYILGDFGVQVSGRHARITPPVRTLTWGDWTRQGLPFYAGNVTYHATLAGTGTDMAVRVPHFSSPVLSVDVDGRTAGKVAFAPFRVPLGAVAPGERRVDVTAYGNRFNAFGHLHNTAERYRWPGPHAWRTEGDGYCYEYQIRPMGIRTAPAVERPAG